jgi:CheY-like chemotaxis protein
LSATKRKTILVVEDELDLLSTIKMVLERNKYLVHGFSDPLFALKHIKEDGCASCKIVLSDIKMPQMTGIELAVHLKRIRPNLKIVLMSAMPVDREDWRNVLPKSENVDDFISKPFSTAELVQLIKKLERK